MRESPWEPLELQLDYWQPLPKFIEKTDKLKQDGKTSLKGLFRGLQVTPSAGSLNVTVHMANKEKKQKSELNSIKISFILKKWKNIIWD